MEGIKRLSKMIDGQKDKCLIKIVNYLMLQQDMDLHFLKEEKNLEDMAKYIRKLAKKSEVNGMAIIDDEEVYKWAKDYFIKSNKELGIEEKTKKEIKEKNKDSENDELGSIFEIKQIDTADTIEQISLFAA